MELFSRKMELYYHTMAVEEHRGRDLQSEYLKKVLAK